MSWKTFIQQKIIQPQGNLSLDFLGTREGGKEFILKLCVPRVSNLILDNNNGITIIDVTVTCVLLLRLYSWM
jgi:hypothetical protein